MNFHRMNCLLSYHTEKLLTHRVLASFRRKLFIKFWISRRHPLGNCFSYLRIPSLFMAKIKITIQCCLLKSQLWPFFEFSISIAKLIAKTYFKHPWSIQIFQSFVKPLSKPTESWIRAVSQSKYTVSKKEQKWQPNPTQVLLKLATLPRPHNKFFILIDWSTLDLPKIFDLP